MERCSLIAYCLICIVNGLNCIVFIQIMAGIFVS